ncbi:MAG: hypothetical protein IJ019_03325 [Alphaproteobacteria bacterium]|nr:hypothetical protein [Alphaproteobacteria bacterium]
MIEVYYICTDNKAYEYALRYYKDDKTEILRCVTEEEKENFFEAGYYNQDKVFYFFGTCGEGYLKAEMSAIENMTDDYCEMIAIPRPERISTVTHKPKEIFFTNPKDEYKVFARLHL